MRVSLLPAKLLALVTLFFLVTHCSGMGTLADRPGAKLADRCTGDFGTSAAASKLETFLVATADFTASAAELEATVTEACQDMGQELGVADSEMEPGPNQSTVAATCAPVSAKLKSELSDLRAAVNVNLSVYAEPPQCEARMVAYADCVGRCEVAVDPGKLQLKCEGGEIRGQCNATCTGRCAVEVEGKCSGRCEGTCGGSCSGTCSGTCEGACSARAADGSCAGSCNGTCKGSCSAGCSGTCEGSCVAKASGKCEGECRGGCSVEFEEPYCTGDVRAPSASAECQASCNASFDARLECRPGQLYVTLEGNVDENLSERFGRVRAAIEGGLGRILSARAKLEKLAASGKAMVNTAGALPNAIGELGVGAAACVTQAAAILPRATASVSVSVKVSASVSASVN